MLLGDYQTAREAAQAAWGYAWARQDAKGDGSVERHAGANEFGETYGWMWQRYREGRVAQRPNLATAWDNWMRCYDNDLPLSLFGPRECVTCGLTLAVDGTCQRARCMTLAQEAALHAACRRHGMPFESQTVIYQGHGHAGDVVLGLELDSGLLTVRVSPTGEVTETTKSWPERDATVSH